MVLFAFQILPLVMAGLFVAAVSHTSGRRAGGIAAIATVAWLGLTGGLAAAGVLDHFEPPRLPVLLVVMVGFLIWASRSRWGRALRRLPLSVLIGFQAFRIVVELGIHEAASQGVAPMEMSWSGWNFDVLSGLSAVVVAPLATRLPTWTLKAWNLVAFGLVLSVVVVGILSMPTPFRVIATDPPNTWIATFPYVWLPTIHVTMAWLGHLVLFQRLRAGGAATTEG